MISSIRFDGLDRLPDPGESHRHRGLLHVRGQGARAHLAPWEHRCDGQSDPGQKPIDPGPEGLAWAAELARFGKIKKVLVHEVSRLARKNSMTHKSVETLEECGVSLSWHAPGVETLIPNGKRNPAASVMLALLAELARGEVELLRERINSGLAEAQQAGWNDNRPRNVPPKAQGHRSPLEVGQSVRNTAKLSGKGFSMVVRVKTALAI
ncbi:MAG: recombinase family protein [Chthoniobacter sp.]